MRSVRRYSEIRRLTVTSNVIQGILLGNIVAGCSDHEAKFDCGGNRSPPNTKTKRMEKEMNLRGEPRRHEGSVALPLACGTVNRMTSA